MGLERFIKHMVLPHTIYTDTIKNMMDEGSIVEGYKKTLKQDFTEDNPLTGPIYKMGKSDGKVEGYTEASNVYEKKLLDQADAFLKQEKLFESERDKYEELLDEYETEIEMLEKKVDKTETENKYLQELLSRERRLRRLA